MGFEPVRDRLRACHDQAAVAAASGFSSPMNSERSRRIASHRKSITARTFARLIISGWMIIQNWRGSENVGRIRCKRESVEAMKFGSTQIHEPATTASICAKMLEDTNQPPAPTPNVGN